MSAVAVPVYYYIIKSQLNGLVLDVQDASPADGANVQTYTRNGTNAQIWFDDPITGTIRTKLNGFCLDVKGGRIAVAPYSVGAGNQLWERKGSAIVDRCSVTNVVGIADNNTAEKAKVIKGPANSGKNQAWAFELV